MKATLRVAVITPYFRETPEILRQCHDSVAGQTYPCLHVMVADGASRAEIAAWPVDHIPLPVSHRDIGSTPRLIGACHAMGLGFDAVAFLDADNWYRNDHIEMLVRAFENSGAGFLSAGRMLCRLDGSVMAECPYTDPAKFVDTSCMMFTRSGFAVLPHWVLMPSYAHTIGDRVMLYHVRAAGVKQAHSAAPTVFYRCGKDRIYRKLGEAVPDGAVAPPDYAAAHARWVADGYPALS